VCGRVSDPAAERSSASFLSRQPKTGGFFSALPLPALEETEPEIFPPSSK
jgi:hypothetical protein